MINVKTIIMPVTGLSCNNCALLVETNVRKLQAVTEANVDFASEKLNITFDPSHLSENDIIACVGRIGYDIAMDKLELPVIGMHGHTDAMTLEKLLFRQNGVITVTVCYGTGHVKLEYIPGMTSVVELAAVIRKAGLNIVQASDTEDIEDVEAYVLASELHKQRNLLMIGLIFTVSLIIFIMARDFRVVGFKYGLYAMLMVATVVQFIVGWLFFVGAYKEFRQYWIVMNKISV